jgi:uncharacterized membrane protein YeaQ/YmgE (transglycosylase-associated protein family)
VRHVIELIIGILLFGFVLGALARLAVPGPDPMPLWLTTLVGVAGSLIGGLVARIFLGSAGSLLFAFIGAVALVIAYRYFVQHRGITGPEAQAQPTRGFGLRRDASTRQERMLRELRDSGVISQAEYEAKQAELRRQSAPPRV